MPSLEHYDAGRDGGIPDRLCIWPVEGARFGLDATFTGVTGYARVEAHERALQNAELAFQLRQELEGAWTIRLGPMPAAEVGIAVTAFVQAGR